MLNSKPSSFKAFILAARPKTLLAGFTPIMIALSYSYEQEKLDTFLAILTITVVILLQIATNYVNDAYDAVDGVDQTDRLGPDRMTSLGYLSFKQMRRGYLTCFIMAFFLGLIIVLLTNLVVLSLGVIAILFAYIYTAGPYPLSRIGLGEVAAFIFFGPYAVYGTLYIQQHDFKGEIVLISTLVAIASALLMNINNLRDRLNDQAVQKTTISTLVSEKTARKFPLILVGINLCVVSWIAFDHHPVFLISAIPWIGWVWLSAKNILFNEIDKSMNKILSLTGAALFTQGLIISMILIL